MTIVRYVNKKTGAVALYESTSHYDPETKQSRPVRKYLGIEDPETKELIPSSGKRGRKKDSDSQATKKQNKNDEPDYKLLYEQLKKELLEKENLIKKLQNENRLKTSCLQRIANIISEEVPSGKETC